MSIQLSPDKLNTLARTSFGDSPLGTVGNRGISVGAGATPRAASLGVGKRISESFSKLLNALAPGDSRASSTVRHAVRDMSRTLGNGLGALTPGKDGKIDAGGIARMLGGLKTAAEPAIARGANYEQLLSARMDQHLGTATLKDLLALRAGIAAAGSEPALEGMKDKVEEFGKTLEAKISGEIDRRFTKASDEVGKVYGKAAVELSTLQGADAETKAKKAFSEAYDVARNALASHGFLGSDSLANDKLVNSLLRSQVSAHPEEARPLLALASSEQLAKLIQAPVLKHSTPLADTMLKLALEDKTAQMEGQIGQTLAVFLQKDDNVHADPLSAYNSPKSFNLELLEIAQAINEFKDHCTRHGIRIPQPIQQQMDDSVSKADNMMTSNAGRFTAFTDETLGIMHNAARKLGLTNTRPMVDNEIAARNHLNAANYQAVFATMTAELASNDATRVLAAFVNLTAAGDNALQAAQLMGGKYEGGDGALDFHFELMHGAMELLTPLQLEALGTGLTAGSTRDLVALLENLGTRVPLDDVDRMSSMLGTASLINGLSQDVAEILDEGAGKALSAAIKTDVKNPSDAARSAVETVFGVVEGKGHDAIITRGTVNNRFATQMGNKIAELAANLGTMESPGAGLPAVSKAFLADLGRATYTLQGVPLVPLGQLTPLQRQNAVASLDHLVGGDQRLLELVSSFANQSSPLAAIEPMLSRHSPFVLADGTRGMPAGGNGSTSYAISRDNTGEIRIDVHHVVDRPDQMQVLTRDGNIQTIALRADSSRAELNFQLKFDTAYGVELEGDITFSNKLVVETWPKAYPRPATLDDLLNPAAPNHAMALADFRAECARQFSDNELAAVEKVRGLRAAVLPTGGVPPLPLAETLLTDARDLFDRFVDNNSPTQANASGQAQVAMTNAFNRVGQAFDVLESTIVTQLHQEYTQQYSAQMTPPAPPTIGAVLANPATRNELRSILERGLTAEPMDFLDAVQAFRQNPSFTQAENIANEFVRPGAPNLLNLGGPDINALNQSLITARQQFNTDLSAALKVLDKDVTEAVLIMLINWVKAVDAGEIS